MNGDQSGTRLLAAILVSTVAVSVYDGRLGVLWAVLVMGAFVLLQRAGGGQDD